MGHYTGIAFNFKVNSDVPVEIHFLFDVLADVDYGGEDEVITSIQKQLPSLSTETLQDLFTALYCSSSYFECWSSDNTNPNVKIRSYKDSRFVSYSSCKFGSERQFAIGRFLNASLPYLDVVPGEVLVRTIYEEGRREYIYWYNERTNSVVFSHDGYKYEFNYSPMECSEHPYSWDSSDPPDTFVPPNNYYVLNPDKRTPVTEPYDELYDGVMGSYKELPETIKEALRSPKVTPGQLMLVTTPGSKKPSHWDSKESKIIGTDLTVSGFKPFSVEKQKSMVERLKTSFKTLEWDHESLDAQLDIKKIQEDFNIRLMETPDGSVQPMLTPKPKHTEQIGVEPPGIPQDKSPTITPFLDTEGPVKIGESIQLLEPNIVYDIPQNLTVPLPDTWKSIQDKLKNGFRPGEMQLISSLMPGKSMLSHVAFPKTMAELRSSPDHIFQSARQTGKTLASLVYFEGYMKNAFEVVKRFNELKAERKTIKFKKRKLRK